MRHQTNGFLFSHSSSSTYEDLHFELPLENFFLEYLQLVYPYLHFHLLNSLLAHREPVPNSPLSPPSVLPLMILASPDDIPLFSPQTKVYKEIPIEHFGFILHVLTSKIRICMRKLSVQQLWSLAPMCGEAPIPIGRHVGKENAK